MITDNKIWAVCLAGDGIVNLFYKKEDAEKFANEKNEEWYLNALHFYGNTDPSLDHYTKMPKREDFEYYYVCEVEIN